MSAPDVIDVDPQAERGLAVVEHDMRVSRAPAVVLEEAKTAAKALTDVIKAKPRQVQFNGETYLEYEDWQTVGRFYGITAKVVSTEFVEFGDAKGFEARAVALRADGMEVSAAEALCLNDEPNWSRKPLFQLKSMAQTRASAKCLRNCLAWVVVLAGYKPTPAEEMDGVASRTPRSERREPEKPAGRPVETAAVSDHDAKPYPTGSWFVQRIAEPSGKAKRYTIDLSTPHSRDGLRVHCFPDKGEWLNTLEDAMQNNRPVFVDYVDKPPYGKNITAVRTATSAPAEDMGEPIDASEIPF